MNIDRRQRILDGAASILDAGALADFTVDTLARNLRMSKSTLYKHFYSKDQVVVDLVDGLCDRSRQALAAVDIDEAESGRVALAEVVDVLAAHYDRMPAAVLLETALLPETTSAKVDEVRRAFRQRVEGALLRGQAEGALLVEDPHLAAAVCVAAMEQAVLTVMRDPVDLTRGDAVFFVHRMLERGLSI